MTAPASSSNTNPSQSSIHANVIPSEVGWQFVPQYYTFMNKQPHRLHCFYTKNSTFIHGTEGEDGRPCYGQQEIHNKILSIGFEDCKVFVHSVDAQASANGGIIIQVIGEMSNRGEPWRKFAQTFFLAEQPNGYFVLNDIFRFLKEESVDAEDEENEQPNATVIAAEVAQETLEPAAPAVQAGHPGVAAQPYDAALPNHLQSKPVAEAPAPESEPVVLEEKKGAPNGIHTPLESEAVSVLQAEPVKQATPEPVQPAEVPRPITPQAPTPQPVTPTPPAPVTISDITPQDPAPPAASKPVPTPPAPAPVPSPKPAALPQAKTWANLAAANSNKWGPQVAQEARGVSAAPPPPPPAPSKESQRNSGDKESGRDHPLYQAALNVTTPQCFVKNVTEVISHQALSSTLGSRFGLVKDLDIVRSKACAFLEFSTLDAARRAILASLPPSAGGEGGIRIDAEGGGGVKIIVETRKEKGERPSARPRTGGTGQERGGGQGGFRGTARGRGAGRGAGKA